VDQEGIAALQARLRVFTDERDWGRFHDPKNLVMALAGEVGELTEIFQWLTPEDAAAVMRGERAADVADELADVALYLVRLADVLGVDLVEVADAKLTRNETRFPVGEVHGRADRPARPAGPLPGSTD
jgi:dCTP diphosphatase